MYAAIRSIKVRKDAVDEVVQLATDSLAPIITSLPGFIEFTGVQVGEDVALTISIFETQEQVDESTRKAAEWIRQNMGQYAAGPHEIQAVGEVRFRQTK